MRAYRNKAEQAFVEWAGGDWDITKRGYPDFICQGKNGDLMLVEVKKTASTDLKSSQKKVFRILAEHGIPCYKWSPDTKELISVSLSGEY